MVTCRDVAERASLYFDDKLGSDLKFQFDQHLRLCGPCRDYLDQMRATIALLRQQPLEPTAKQAEEAAVSQFKSWVRNRSG